MLTEVERGLKRYSSRRNNRGRKKVEGSTGIAPRTTSR
jgi:hypothetical protein